MWFPRDRGLPSRCISPGGSHLLGLLSWISLIAGCQALVLVDLAAAELRPNVVMIVTDDQGWADIGYNNPARAYTPHLDALAASGARLDQHYVMPQCTPTRVACLTGRLPSRFGGHALAASNEPAFPLGTPTMATMLQQAGYKTFLCGKWHLGSTPEHGPLQFGFDHAYGSLTGAVGMYDHRYRKGPFEFTWHRDGNLIAGSENGRHATDLIADEAVRIIENDHAAPFFLFLPFHAPHTPLDERGRFTGQPTQLDPARPNRWLHEDEIEWFNDPEGRIQSEADPERRLLLAAVHHVDHAIGRVVDALERKAIRESTLVLFSSDNGPQINWPGNAYPDDLKLTDFNQPLPLRGHKCDVWEGGILVPGIISWPGRIPSRRINAPVHIVDWIPTVAEAVNVEPPTEQDGLSLWQLLENDAPLPDRSFYWTWRSPINRRAIRRGDWKMVHYGKDPPRTAEDWKLFNLQADPREQHDRASQQPAKAAALHQAFLKQASRDAPSLRPPPAASTQSAR